MAVVLRLIRHFSYHCFLNKERCLDPSVARYATIGDPELNPHADVVLQSS